MGERIGIYAGTFDPVHTGHITFALEAAKRSHLSRVIMLPERQPRYKQGITHFAHRLSMLKSALKPYKNISVLELPDKYFTIKQTLPRLQEQYPDAELIMLLGSDVLKHLPRWPLVDQLLSQCGLVIAMRNDENYYLGKSLLQLLPHPPKEVILLPAPEPAVASKAIRQAIGQGKTTAGLLPSVARYSRKHWLYSVVPASSS